MIKSILFSTALLAGFHVGIACAQPFGVAMGTPKAKLTITGEDGPGLYYITPPKAHPYFIDYHAMASLHQGVCLISADSNTIENDAYGDQARRDVARLRGQLEAIYGPGTLVDNLKLGSIWSEPREWSKSINTHQRVYEINWEARNLKNHIGRISLSVLGLERERTFIHITYVFENAVKCSDEIQAAEKGAF